LACGFLRARNAVLEPQAWRALFLHRWPGNVRELQKTLRFATVVAGASPSIGFEHLPPGMSPVAAVPNAMAVGASSGSAGSSATITLGAVSRTLRPERPTRQALVELLKRHGGDVASMARTMGRQRTLVWRWLRQDGVDPQVYRAGSDPVEDTEVQSEDAEPRPRPPEETLPFQSVKGRYTGEA
jgi:transcriptional regulator of acetoin/glycerol metabolism